MNKKIIFTTLCVLLLAPTVLFAQQRKTYKGGYNYEFAIGFCRVADLGHAVCKHSCSSEVEYEYIEIENGRILDGHFKSPYMEGNYKRGIKDGAWRFKPRNDTEVRVTYKDGLLNGDFVRILLRNDRPWITDNRTYIIIKDPNEKKDDNIIRVDVLPFKDGKPHGSFRFERDTELFTGQFVDGNKRGKWIHDYYEEGIHFTETADFDNGYYDSENDWNPKISIYDESTGVTEQSWDHWWSDVYEVNNPLYFFLGHRYLRNYFWSNYNEYSGTYGEETSNAISAGYYTYFDEFERTPHALERKKKEEAQRKIAEQAEQERQAQQERLRKEREEQKKQEEEAKKAREEQAKREKTIQAEKERMTIVQELKAKNLPYWYVLSYYHSRPFSEGLAAISENGRWGFIDQTGKTVVPFIYEKVNDFSDGLAAVEKSKYKWGVVDKTGKEVVPCIYSSIEPEYEYGRTTPFSNGVAFVTKAGKDGRSRHGFIDKTGKELTPFIFSNTLITISDRLVKIEDGYGNDRIFDRTTKELNPIVYDYIGKLSEGRILVRKNGKIGYVDTAGIEVIPCKYLYSLSSDFSEGLASLTKYKKYGCIDKNGNEVIPFVYDGIGNFHEGLAWAKKNKKYGYIDQSGKEVIPFMYDFGKDFSDGLAPVEKNGKWGLIDNKKGKEVVPCDYEDVWDFSEKLARVEKDGKYGFIDKKKGKVVHPCVYENIRLHLDEGGLCLSKDGKFGFIDKNGKEIVPFVYDNIYHERFDGNWATVVKNGKWGIIDLTGKEIVPSVYDNISHDRFDGNWAIVVKNGKRGIIDLTTGKEIVPCIFEDKIDISYVSNNDYFILMCENKYYYAMIYRWILIDKEGNRIEKGGKINWNN
ncbi:MAG: WG repeat-containing protein [Prevotellaceae bacterium]|jgi:hypothetical protein|nr:WG repeat-containing protein [Prevotellaceae bacterium]